MVIITRSVPGAFCLHWSLHPSGIFRPGVAHPGLPNSGQPGAVRKNWQGHDSRLFPNSGVQRDAASLRPSSAVAVHACQGGRGGAGGGAQLCNGAHASPPGVLQCRGDKLVSGSNAKRIRLWAVAAVRELRAQGAKAR